MEILTAHALTALHSLCHRIALTEEELKAISSKLGTPSPESSKLGTPSPELWRETERLLETADGAGDGTRIDIGFNSLILKWLGMKDEQECIGRYGHTIEDALEKDRGHLSITARTCDQKLNSPKNHLEKDFINAQCDIWLNRSTLLSKFDGEEAALLALNRIIELAPFLGSTPINSREEFVQRCINADLLEIAETARLGPERVSYGIDSQTTELKITPEATIVLSALWCITHGRMLLASELALDLEIEPTTAAWRRIWAAAREGRVDAIPIPTNTIRVGWGKPDVDENALREGLHQSTEGLQVIHAMAEAIWGKICEPVKDVHIRPTLSVVEMRRSQIQNDYHPPSGSGMNIWHEVHQGEQRPETLERARIIRDLDDVLERYAEIYSTGGVVALWDRATENFLRGRIEEALAQTDRAISLLDTADNLSNPESLIIFAATIALTAGDHEKANSLLAHCSTEHTLSLKREIENTKLARRKLRDAEKKYRKRNDLESRHKLANAHTDAGNYRVAERILDEICIRDAGNTCAWRGKAKLLFGAGRFRDAIEPARIALWNGADDPRDKALLAHILNSIGSDGEVEAIVMAVAAISGLNELGPDYAMELLALAEIASKGDKARHTGN